MNNKYKQLLLFLKLYPTNNINNLNINKRQLMGVFIKNIKKKKDLLLLLYTLAYFKINTNRMNSETYCPSIFTFLRTYKDYSSFVNDWLSKLKKPKKYEKIDMKKYGLDL